MGKYWIKFGCFLTGYNYYIVRSSSEVAAKAVKRYTSAILMVSLLWAFVGYTFTERYLEGSTWACVAGAAIAVFIIVQIERQIILVVQPSFGLMLSRALIAIMMALIGAVIIDQIIFKQDIELEKITFIEERVKKALPPKTAELRAQIAALDTTIASKENERAVLISDVNARPLIKSTTTQTIPVTVRRTEFDADGRPVTVDRVERHVTASVSNVPNPNQSLIAPLEASITALRADRLQKETALLNVRPALENEIKSKIGFLDELKVMFNLISGSGVALSVWLLWFFFLVGIESLVLISKVTDKKNDYEETVLHHMNLQLKKLRVLEKHVINN